MIAEEVISKLIDCDDFHKRCDYLLEHSEITYLLDYIFSLQEENVRLKELCNKYEVEHSTVFNEWKEGIEKNGT